MRGAYDCRCSSLFLDASGVVFVFRREYSSLSPLLYHLPVCTPPHALPKNRQGSHNAAVDARMTMELHNLWRRSGQPEQPFGLPLSFFVVNFHSFKPSSNRHATLWGVLRPDVIARGSGGVIEKDSGSNTYK